MKTPPLRKPDVLRRELVAAAGFLRARVPAFFRGDGPDAAVVLGSGMGHFARGLSHAASLPYSRIPGFADATVPGHAGRLVLGRMGGKKVAVMEGRLHFYEGLPFERVTFPCRALKQLGAKVLVLTSAVGAVSSRLSVGDMVLVRDHINFMGANPLRGFPAAGAGPRFPDMTRAYSPSLRALARRAARSWGLTLKEGVYCAVSGPSYETPAEIRMMKSWGVDVVGMSVVPETLAAVQEGMEVLAVAYVANKAAGLSGRPLAHEDVLARAQKAGARLSALLSCVIQRL